MVGPYVGLGGGMRIHRTGDGCERFGWSCFGHVVVRLRSLKIVVSLENLSQAYSDFVLCHAVGAARASLVLLRCTRKIFSRVAVLITKDIKLESLVYSPSLLAIITLQGRSGYVRIACVAEACEGGTEPVFTSF